MVTDVPHPPACSEEGLAEPGPMTVDRIADIAKALGHPARVEIVEQFIEGRCHMAHEIADHCELAQSTVSEHLRILREADIIFGRKDGPRIWYCLRRSVLREFALAVDELRLTSNLLARS